MHHILEHDFDDYFLNAALFKFRDQKELVNDPTIGALWLVFYLKDFIIKSSVMPDQQLKKEREHLRSTLSSLFASVFTQDHEIIDLIRDDHIKGLESGLQQREQQISELTGAVRGKEELILHLEEQITDFSGQLKEKEQQINELNGAVQGKDEQLRNLEGQITDFSGQLKEKEQQIKELNGAVQGKDGQLRNLEGQITDFSGQLKEKEQQIKELNGAVQGKDGQLRNLEGQITDFSGQLKEKEQQIKELKGTVQGKDEQIQNLEGQITDFSGQLAEKDKKIDVLNVAVLGKEEQIRTLEGQITNISSQLREMEGRIREIEMENLRIDSELNSIKSSVTWRIVMKWHSFIEKSMPQETRRRRYYDLRLIGLRTITNEGWKSFWWKYKQHRSSRKHKELITKSTEGKILENAQDRTEMLDPMDDYTKKTKIWLDNRFKLCDNEGIYIAHQPIYGFRKGHSEPGLADKYCRTYHIMKALSYLEFYSLLDVGGAEGYKAHVVKEIFDTEVRNSDLSEEACKRCEEIFHIKSDPIDLHNLPYDDDAFEVILCSETLEHVTDWRKAINELFRVASKAIVITVPHEDEAVIRENIKNGIPHGHIHNFTPNSFNFLEFKGYTVISKKIISKYFRLSIEPELKYSQNSGCTRLIKKIFGKKIASFIIKSDNLFVKFGKRFDGILFVILKDKKALLEHKKKKISAHQIISIEVPYYYLK
jgi:predicted  nucleic acid-binding Zn-ribbon protein/2-polyprenyl-3-methyl-5-hydroxy-6-metoxy-1,4-benzoquinol methylase